MILNFSSDTVQEVLKLVPSVPTFLHVLGTLLVVGILVTPLERCFPSHHRRRKMRSETLNILYWFFTPVVTRFVTNTILVVMLFAIFYLQQRPMDNSLLDGFGPLARQPLWLQSLEILIAADFIEYWTHRFFHRRTLWKIHAIHHSAEHMNWLASARMHPLNDLITRICQVLPLVAIGFSIRGILTIIPLLFFYVVFLHSNIRWDFGPLRYLLVSPSYHQWHHTSDAEGLDKNFAGIFPLWDILFGTCYFPKHSPKKFGVTKNHPPESLMGQLLYPFRASS